MEIENITIALIGSTGMVGQSIRAYASKNLPKVKVVGIARHFSDINIDITNSHLLNQSLDAIKPDVVINAAAITDLKYCEINPTMAYMVNAYPVLNLANYCKLRSIKFCHISTDHFSSSEFSNTHDEESPVLLLNQYAASKFAGECFAKTNINSLIIRTNVVGFRNWKNKNTFLEWAIESLIEKKKMILFDDFYTSSIDTTSFAKFLFKCLKLDLKGLLNLASREPASKKDFIINLAKIFGFNELQWEVGSVKNLTDVRRPSNLSLNVSLATTLLGQGMPSLDEVLRSIKLQYDQKKYEIQ